MLNHNVILYSYSQISLFSWLTVCHSRILWFFYTNNLFIQSAKILTCYSYCIAISQCTHNDKNMSHNLPALKIRTICDARDLWKLARSCKLLHSLCPPDPWNFQALPYSVDYKGPGKLLNPLRKTVLSQLKTFFCGVPTVIHPGTWLYLIEAVAWHISHAIPLTAQLVLVGQGWINSTHYDLMMPYGDTDLGHHYRQVSNISRTE